jgi:hypothetical protein
MRHSGGPMNPRFSAPALGYSLYFWRNGHASRSGWIVVAPALNSHDV